MVTITDEQVPISQNGAGLHALPGNVILKVMLSGEHASLVGDPRKTPGHIIIKGL